MVAGIVRCEFERLKMEDLESKARRDFLKLSGLTLLAISTGQISCSRKPDEVETELFRDFLNFTPESALDQVDIGQLLYDIETKVRTKKGIEGKTKGRAVSIGDGYFLTAFHVIDPEESKKEAREMAQDMSLRLEDISVKLVPQNRRGYGTDFAQGFEVAYRDRESDLALLKAPVENRSGRAKVHLASPSLSIGQAVSTFFWVSGIPKVVKYEFELNGRNYYDNATTMRLGKLILPANSLLFEKQGWVLPYNPDLMRKSSDDTDQSLIPVKDGNFSSIMSYNGESGSPVFVRLRNGKYIFAGILTAGWQIEYYIKTPENPLGYSHMAQTGTIFAHREPIARLISGYNPGVKK